MTMIFIIMAAEIRKNAKPSEKEEQILNIFWAHGPLFVKEVQGLLPEPRPHVNTVATMVRSLESKGYLKHESFGGAFRYSAAFSKDQYKSESFGELVRKYFKDSWRLAVSSFVKEEKLSADDLREILADLENMKKTGHE